MIRESHRDEISTIFRIVNDAAQAYAGNIPDDCYHVPYMSIDELENEMRRVVFYGWEENGQLQGVMGLEAIKEVTLIRHAYVLTEKQGLGIGRKLLAHLETQTLTRRLLVGTWAGASWAVDFYKRNGFHLAAEKELLLNTYWNNHSRQNEASVVLEKTLKQGLNLPTANEKYTNPNSG
jgi:GNAT superfamily N-acetyltransferase